MTVACGTVCVFVRYMTALSVGSCVHFRKYYIFCVYVGFQEIKRKVEKYKVLDKFIKKVITKLLF